MTRRESRQSASLVPVVLNATWSDSPPASPLPSTYAGLPADVDSFSCGDWTVYIKRMREALGVSQAREYMLLDFGHLSMFNVYFGTCELDCAFVAEVNKLDQDVLSILSSTYCGATELAEDVVEFTKEVVGIGTETAKTGSSLAKNLRWMIPVGLAVGAGAYGYKKGWFKK